MERNGTNPDIGAKKEGKSNLVDTKQHPRTIDPFPAQKSPFSLAKTKETEQETEV